MITTNRVWVSDQGDGTYKNPVLFADYSDPDAIRVGEDFYLVASSFCNTPGLPVLHSKDLVNWRIINHAVKSLDFDYYAMPAHGKGIWEPSIRYHANKFWIFYPTPDEGIFMTTATDPAGEWSQPVHMKKARGWIDPCPFWDDDGKAYLVYAFAGSRTGFGSVLSLSEMKPDGTALLDDGVYVFDGNEKQHPTIEGPKLYKRNGYYYIFAPAGGVPRGWQTVLRSKSIYGPYEDRIVLHQGSTPVNGPHQGAYIELESGEGWFLHFQEKGAFGRILHLQPVKWVDDWPVMGINPDGDGRGEPVEKWEKPRVGRTYPITEPDTGDAFRGGELGLQWQWNANSKASWFSLTAREEGIRLFPASTTVNKEPCLCVYPALLLQKFPAPGFTAFTKLNLHPEKAGDCAGLVILGGEYAALLLEKTEGGIALKQLKGSNLARQNKASVEGIVAEAPVEDGPIYLKVTVDEEAVCRFGFSRDGRKYDAFGESLKATAGFWVGAKMGIFYKGSEGEGGGGYADFQWFRVEAGT